MAGGHAYRPVERTLSGGTTELAVGADRGKSGGVYGGQKPGGREEAEGLDSAAMTQGRLNPFVCKPSHHFFLLGYTPPK